MLQLSWVDGTHFSNLLKRNYAKTTGPLESVTQPLILDLINELSLICCPCPQNSPINTKWVYFHSIIGILFKNLPSARPGGTGLKS